MTITQSGSVITIRDDKDKLLKQYKCDCYEEAKRIVANFKLKWGVK